MVLNVTGAKIIFKKENSKKTIKFLVDNKDYGEAVIPSANFGNYWFLQFKNNPNIFSVVYDEFFLDLAAFHKDYDSFSDMYKDVNNVRPHYTQEQWDKRIRIAQNRKP